LLLLAVGSLVAAHGIVRGDSRDPTAFVPFDSPPASVKPSEKVAVSIVSSLTGKSRTFTVNGAAYYPEGTKLLVALRHEKQTNYFARAWTNVHNRVFTIQIGPYTKAIPGGGITADVWFSFEDQAPGVKQLLRGQKYFAHDPPYPFEAKSRASDTDHSRVNDLTESVKVEKDAVGKALEELEAARKGVTTALDNGNKNAMTDLQADMKRIMDTLAKGKADRQFDLFPEALTQVTAFAQAIDEEARAKQAPAQIQVKELETAGKKIQAASDWIKKFEKDANYIDRAWIVINAIANEKAKEIAQLRRIARAMKQVRVLLDERKKGGPKTEPVKTFSIEARDPLTTPTGEYAFEDGGELRFGPGYKLVYKLTSNLIYQATRKSGSSEQVDLAKLEDDVQLDPRIFDTSRGEMVRPEEAGEHTKGKLLKGIPNDLAGEIKDPGTPFSTAFSLKGKAPDAPNGATADVFLLYQGAVVTSTSTTLWNGEISVQFGPWKDKRVLAGVYNAKVRLNEETGLKLTKDSVSFELKDNGQTAKELESIKKKMLETVEFYRLPFLTLATSGSYYLQAITVPMAYFKDPKQPKEVRDRAKQEFDTQVKDATPGWTRLDEAAWDAEFKTARADWRSYRKQFLGLPNPEAEQLLIQLERAIMTWHDRMNVGLHTLCGLPRPAIEGEKEPSDLQGAMTYVGQIAHALYAKLGVNPTPAFTPTTLAQHEKFVPGNDPNWFHSKLTHFAVGKPASWSFVPNGHKPTIRLRIFSIDVAAIKSGAKVQSDIVAYVELFDYPGARNDTELAALHREREHIRWGNTNKTLIQKDINVKDPTMPGGQRGGLDYEGTFEDPKFGKLHVRDFALFCRFHKRTYCVVCIAPDNQWASLKDTFESITKGFRVLDGAEFKDVPKNMKEAEIRAEGRDPAEAIKNAPDWELGKDLKK
jgi:hypothetical protein